MKHRHKVAAGIALPTIGLLTALVGAWRAHEEADRAEAAQAGFACSVAVCEAQGGRWYRGDCLTDGRGIARQPK